MSREIKFRAWDINHKKWYTRVNVGTNCCNSVYDDERETWLEFDEHCGEVVQFTGLKDRVGKEIYEGDIVKHKQIGADKRTRGEVTIHPTQGVKVGNWPINFDYEVIGNIYEHPHLLTKEETQ